LADSYKFKGEVDDSLKQEQSYVRLRKKKNTKTDIQNFNFTPCFLTKLQRCHPHKQVYKNGFEKGVSTNNFPFVRCFSLSAYT